ncbi:hypothetical protein RAB80_017096 [Fusarium oxysporum f. sp. vasinfectum]|nr:hypothetical protein RAB80_017096 [Fusarium oxysporum f. sp. vasinfectum]
MTEQLITEYSRTAEDYRRKAIEVLNKKRESSSANTRTQEDTATIHDLLVDSMLRKPLTADQVLNTNTWKDLEKDIVVCSEDDACRIFERQVPPFPILVGPLTRETGTIQDFLKSIDPATDVDVHDFSLDVSVHGRIPQKMKGNIAIKMFEDETRIDPVNFLNLHILEDNPLPSFLRNRKDYNILEFSHAEKRKRTSQQSAADLDRWTSFQLLASEGAVHLPHIDHHGMNTVVFNEEGHKMWLMWPGIGPDEISEVCGSRKHLQGGLPVYVPPRYMLWQPLGTLHAPITITNCLMSGRMLVHSSQLLDTLKYTRAGIKDPDITNEAFSRQMYQRMTRTLHLWKKESNLTEAGQQTFAWPPPESQKECEEICKAVSAALKVANRAFVFDITGPATRDAMMLARPTNVLIEEGYAPRKQF